jgi:acetyl-CoA carboxylase biotin carboxyl carrier protein
MSGDIPLTPEDVAEIVAILDGSGYATLDVKTSRFRLRVARDAEGWTQEWDCSDEQDRPQPPTRDQVELAADADDASAVLAPLPGTFYRAPQPGAPPFVEVGSSVTPDTVIGIIETMKLMNPVHAGATGSITAILVENGEMVGKNTTLMRLS